MTPLDLELSMDDSYRISCLKRSREIPQLLFLAGAKTAGEVTGVMMAEK
jgi:hypothetical protein